ncbi:hypothetical protein BvCmsNSNP012_04862 [Escherichia coli]|nr:hypothetical protein BvCmsNSNP012_04862 [Escherichia coli]
MRIPEKFRDDFWQPDRKSFGRFCAGAMPRYRQINGTKNHETNSASFRLSCTLRRSKKPKNGKGIRDRMWECRTAHAHSDIPHLVRTAPRHPASVRTCSQQAHQNPVPAGYVDTGTTELAAIQLVGDYRDYTVGSLGFSPDCSGCSQSSAGTMAATGFVKD